MLDTCEPLREYSWLMQEIRNNRKSMEIEDAVDKALADMPQDYVIKPCLDAHKTEVSGMLLTEYNEAETMEMFERYGKRKQMIEDARGMQKEGIGFEVIARILKISVEEVKTILGIKTNLA